MQHWLMGEGGKCLVFIGARIRAIEPGKFARLKLHKGFGAHLFSRSPLQQRERKSSVHVKLGIFHDLLRTK